MRKAGFLFPVAIGLWMVFLGAPGGVVLTAEVEPISETLVEETKDTGLYIMLGVLCGLGGIVGATYYIRRRWGKSPQGNEKHVQSSGKVT